MKKMAIVGGIATYTTNMTESGGDVEYVVTEETCKLCYEIFGKRTEEQCKKCKQGASNEYTVALNISGKHKTIQFKSKTLARKVGPGYKDIKIL